MGANIRGQTLDSRDCDDEDQVSEHAMSGHVRNNSDAIQTTDDFSVSFETINEQQPAEASSAGCAEIQQHDLHMPWHEIKAVTRLRWPFPPERWQ